MTNTQQIRDRGGVPIEIGCRAAMHLPGRPRRVVFGVVRAVGPERVEIWDDETGMQMFHSTHPDRVRILR